MVIGTAIFTPMLPTPFVPPMQYWKVAAGLLSCSEVAVWTP